MLAVKLKLIGKKGQHSFRVIVQEKRAKLQGKYVEDLGWFNPHSNQAKLNQERLKYWLNNGAQLTQSAQRIVEKVGAGADTQSFGGRKTPKKRKKDRKAAPEAMPAASGESIVPTAVTDREEAAAEVAETPAET
jgi:small subunit ribosomal protein S16